MPDNGRRIGKVFSSGSTVFYRCFDDYDLVGSKYRVCQEDGSWSSDTPTCVPFKSKYCVISTGTCTGIQQLVVHVLYSVCPIYPNNIYQLHKFNLKG